MPIKIISLRDGFRRCGIEHPTGPVVYPDGKFTPEQLAKLKAEPLLVVEELPAEEKPKKKAEKAAGDPPNDSGQNLQGDK